MTLQPCLKIGAARLDYMVDSTQRLITISGDYADAEEWKGVLARMFHDGRIESGFGLLRDLRPAKGDPDHATTLGIIEAIRWFWAMLQPSGVAVLTRPTFDASTLHRLAAEHGLRVRAFTSHPAAIAWLRVELRNATSGTGHLRG